MAFKDEERSREYHRQWRMANRDKTKAYHAKHGQKHPDAVRARHRKHRYGITIADYDRLKVTQGGVCAICGRQPEDTKRGIFVVDHDHQTKLVRALLCNDCNLAVANVGESPLVAEALVRYLRVHKRPHAA